MNSNENNGSRIAQVNSEESAGRRRVPAAASASDGACSWLKTVRMRNNPRAHATREGSDGKSGIEKSKLIMLGGGLLVAVLFLALHEPGQPLVHDKEGGREAAKQSGTAANAKPNPRGASRL